jgi:NitT/TauT family transport system permease protein
VLSRSYAPELWPGPLLVLSALSGLVREGILASNVLASLGRMLAGFGLALALALPTGLGFGAWSRGYTAVDPVIQVLRPISPIAWFPLAVVWFGVGDRPAVFIIALATFFPVFLATVGAVRAVPMNFVRLAENFGGSRLFLFARVLVPAAFIQILTALRIAVGIAWVNLVAGEMLGAQSGLGYLIVDARNSLRTDRIVAVMIVIGLLGFSLDRLTALLAKLVREVRVE